MYTGAPVGLATPPDVMLQSALADQTALLQICLARVGSFLKRAKAALSSLSLAPALSQTTPMSRPPGVADVGSIEKGDQELYGCFSPRVGISSSSVVPLCRLLPRARPSPRSSPLCSRSCPSFNRFVCDLLRLYLWSIWRSTR